MGITLSVAARNAAVAAVVSLIDAGGAGTLEITTAGDPTFASLLAHLPMSATSFAAPSGGSANANSITSDTNTNPGVAALFRIKSGGGGTEILRGTVGTGGTDIIFNTTTFTSGGICAISSLVASQP